ncbi:hypothetical protein GOP47_0004479 [Adiantum capillus-veneris]|uniref:Pentatricopeptide repeat-containing protein n=1 Tax=Adiantum capillus-veneris TaxID=13818 RepID=A0A9D4ZPR0_ADICA|nr:hypothetical protein GOP47_0004479 [Adiantum capillus-veneris]
MFSNVDRQSLQEHLALVALLKTCARQKDVCKGTILHADVLRRGLLEQNVFIGSTLVDMYSKCGALAKAQQAFDDLLRRDVVCWTALIIGYTHHGHGERALICLQKMKLEGFLPDAVTFACTLRACGSIGATEMGEEIHLEIARKQLLENDIVLGNALVDMYAKCGALSKAQQVLNELPVQDVVSWNALITGYVHSGHDEQAIECLELMQSKGMSPNAVTLLCVLQACGSLGALDKAKQIHVGIVSKGLLKIHDLLGNALVDMYARCGALEQAQQVLNELPVQTKVSWTALISGYCQHGQHEKALACYQKMQSEGLPSDALTLAWVLKACGSMRALEKGKEVHADIAREGFLENDHVLANALVDMYAKCGALAIAEQVFDELLMCNAASSTALITGYFQQGHGEEALACFERMQHNGISPDIVTLLCILQVCGSLGAIQKGEEIHAKVVKEGLLGNYCGLGNLLVDMYMKCGGVAKAQLIFDGIGVRDVVSWTALMTGYAQAGKHECVFCLFDEMIGHGTAPNSVTLTVVLKSCTDLSLLSKGLTYFETMSSSYGITPTLEHHTWIVDLFGRAGYFDKAMEVAKRVPSSDHLPTWLALLGACRKWENVVIGRIAFENILRLDRMDTAAYACMSDIYAVALVKEELIHF